ncbi:hypothetical protein CDCA_CDCA16G4276 [Cyanidium caldarium]|uniref:Thioredoxin-like fold domain-containing protein n=1 Tax=Cyanidium caldarium TaxID=2771 RepID=A0AAV9J1K5_CYACA|nr:hypothetical protein CDCA_CDCA16G4276 [Cyanidium caldarium]
MYSVRRRAVSSFVATLAPSWTSRYCSERSVSASTARRTRSIGVFHRGVGSSGRRVGSRIARAFTTMSALPPLPWRSVAVPRPHHADNASQKEQVLVEAFLDYNCPYSKRMFDVWTKSVIPRYADDGRVQFAFCNVPQPWHAQSCYMHEAALAARRIGGDEAFWRASQVLFDRQDDLVDERVYELSRRAVYEKLAEMLQSAGVVKDARQLMEWLQTGSGNDGNRIGQDLKFSCRYHRMRGVHVTPTVVINGIVDAAASSSWTGEQWIERVDGLLQAGDGMK